MNEIKGQIQASFTKCLECEEIIDCWPDADLSEPGNKVIYVAREAIFVGVCHRGHYTEFYLAEARAGEVIPHYPTERTLGRPVPQADCIHGNRREQEIGAGMIVMTESGPFEGPGTVIYCGNCAARFRPKKSEPSDTDGFEPA